MPRPIAAGLVMVRVGSPARYLLVHPGGPYYRRQDEHVWSIPKGLPEAGEALFDCARREMREETGFEPPTEGYVELGVVRQSNKNVHAWAFREDRWDPATLVSEPFELEWPPRSGQRASFPEVDRGAFFTLEEAAPKIVKAQLALLERAAERLDEL